MSLLSIAADRYSEYDLQGRGNTFRASVCDPHFSVPVRHIDMPVDVFNKADAISLEQVDKLAHQDHTVVISCELGLKWAPSLSSVTGLSHMLAVPT